MAHLTLFQFNQQLKETLQAQIAPQQWVIAEIGELRINQKGHCYMELVEKEGNFIQAKIRANIWAYQFKSLSQAFRLATGSTLSPGQKILLNVTANFHEVYGLSLTVNDIDPNFTLGERSKQREAILKRLSAAGALDQNSSLPLPLVPQQVAVISSATAAGYQDFEEHLQNNPRQVDFRLTLFNALMQGDQAPPSIIDAIDRIEASGRFDVIVLIRGGGAQTDLDCFDDEALCMRISKLQTPILTGIGHQRDQTLTDLVAHTALKTPTAVAEFLIDGAYRFDDALHDALLRIKRSLSQSLQLRINELEKFEIRLEREVNHQLDKADNVLTQLSTIIQHRGKQRLKILQTELTQLSDRIYLNDPNTLFKKGYTITLKNGKRIQEQNVNSGDEILTIGAGLSIKSNVIDK